MIFPSLISGICLAVGVTVEAGEMPGKLSPLIKRATFEAQERARMRKREQDRLEQQRHNEQGEGQAAENIHLPQAPPQPAEMDSQLLRQIFATATRTSRDIQNLQQRFETMTTTIEKVQRDLYFSQDYTKGAMNEATTARRKVETMNGRFNMYAGRMDGIQWRMNETWDRLGSMESRLQAIQAEQAQQCELLRQLLSRLPSPPKDDAAGPSFTPQPSN
ncbi:uncharacterized protein LOC111396712 [Olea europaea var. sylvestris]|uniref:uncharacterized protein LOC111396712 n=1 Tax=Olea europaea var. sylvestris TaxID=158386 RepID=UPI000C1D3E39|nr:uncharacterized protein LOC111396712 [Olea europaea var. sylvestris]XP_022878956.1 uncharacterized protein LOC111396712 [Olea europaea var. sylvestris]